MLNDADSVKTEVTGTQPCDLINPPPKTGEGKDTDHSMRNLFILLFAFVMLAVLAFVGLYLIGFLGLEEEKTLHVTTNKPYCGDEKCGMGESCENCAKDCRCGLYEECSTGECVQKKQVSSYIYEEPRSYYSIDLPDVKGGVWNISYTPRSDRIYITAPQCFYLNVLSPRGEIYPYKAEDSAGRNITVCTSANGGKYNLTSPRIAAWFNWNGCARTKYYNVVKNQELTLHVYTDNCADCMCTYPNFDIYEQVQGNWNKYEPTNKSAVDDCANMSSADSRKECVYHLAMRRVDSSLCEQLANDGGKWSRDECIRHVAIKDLNYPTCLKINRTASKEWCISTIAYILEDPSVCAQMNTQPDKDVCYRSVAYEKNDPSICDKMEIDDQRDWCYYHLAYRLKQQAVCEKIKGSDVLNLCRGDVSGDLSFCGKIGLENLKEMCMEHNSIINKPEEPANSSTKAGPYCGDSMCSTYEDYMTCPQDCGQEETNYSVDLPSEPGRGWNLEYIPKSDEMKISSDNCFYLDLEYSSGQKINPYKADVATCGVGAGQIYNATGEGSADWFNWGCASEKYYKVTPGRRITLYVRTDMESCKNPQFNVYEKLMGRWLQEHIDYKESESQCLTEGWGYGYPLTPEGLAEGEKYANETCCEGLIKIFDNYTLDPEGKCQETVGYTRWFCSKCGDDKCDERYENKCNCPEDCALSAGNAGMTERVDVITPDCPESGPLEGIYFGGNGTVLGKCVKMDSNCSQYVDFFNLQGEFIGSCWVYSGPGGSGYEGGCSNSAVGDPNAIGVAGAASRRYYCFIPKYPVVSLDVNSPDISPFIEYGCESDPRNMDWLNCSKTGLREEFSCVDNGSMKPSAGIFIPPKYLSYLKPQMPIVSCSETFLGGGPESAICSEGTPLMRYYQRYIVMTPQGPQSIASREDFVKAFSPVESPEEALAFAVALTCDSPVLPDLTYLQDNTLYKTNTAEFMEYTKKAAENVSTINLAEYYNGYQISLYKTERVGCGKPVYEMVYFVYRNGTVLEMDKETVIQVPGPCWA